MKQVYDYLNQMIKNDSIIGMGSGTTIEGYIPSLAEYITQNHMNVKFVPTSKKTEKALKQNQLTVAYNVPDIEFTIDGADQFNSQLQVIKGGGGSLLREKQIGYFSKYIIIVAKDSKEVSSFENIKIPVEVNPFLYELTKRRLQDLGAETAYRMANDALFISDNGNYIVDCLFHSLTHLNMLQENLLSIPGVVETGIFNHFIKKIVTFNDDNMTVYEEK
jgi:ribose 5-phosphate isomerase A